MRAGLYLPFRYMSLFLPYDNQIKLINSIIVSTNKLLPLIKDNTELTDTINITILQIFQFLEKILDLVPDLLMTEKKMNFYKEELTGSFNKVISNWETFTDNRDEFFDAWRDFNFWWKELNKTIEKLKESDNTIYLSMN